MYLLKMFICKLFLPLEFLNVQFCGFEWENITLEQTAQPLGGSIYFCILQSVLNFKSFFQIFFLKMMVAYLKKKSEQCYACITIQFLFEDFIIHIICI